MMKFLLDTHTFLWLINELYSSKLSETVKKFFSLNPDLPDFRINRITPKSLWFLILKIL
jgi:hypothetical protein